MKEMNFGDKLGTRGAAAVERLRGMPETALAAGGIEGALTAIERLFKAFKYEVVNGYSNAVNVEIIGENEIRISAKNRGLRIFSVDLVRARLYNHFLPVYDEKMGYVYIKELYKTRLSLLFGDEQKKIKPFDTDEYDLCSESLYIINWVSEYFDVTSNRDGKRTHLLTEKGKVKDYKITEMNEVNGTSIAFKLDKEVFGDISISGKMLCPMLQCAAKNCPGAEFSIKSDDFSGTFC